MVFSRSWRTVLEGWVVASTERNMSPQADTCFNKPQGYMVDCALACASVTHTHSMLPCVPPPQICRRYDELEAAWGLYTPVLHELEAIGVAPELYPYGSRGPLGAHYLAAKYGVRWGDLHEDDDDV